MNVIVKSGLNIPLGLGFLEALVIISLELNKRLKDVFVLLRIAISQKDWLHSLLLLLLLRT